MRADRVAGKKGSKGILRMIIIIALSSAADIADAGATGTFSCYLAQAASQNFEEMCSSLCGD